MFKHIFTSLVSLITRHQCVVIWLQREQKDKRPKVKGEYDNYRR